MKENKAEPTAQNSLLKIFSTVLRDRSKSEQQFQTITPEMVKFFTRKELIEIVTHNFNGNVSQYNLVEMENEEILLLIGDDYRIISYVMSRWSKEISQLPTKQEWLDAKINSIREPAQVSAEGTTQESLNNTSESGTTKNQEANGSVSENQITDITATQQSVETEGNTTAEDSESPKSSDKKLPEKKQEETPSSKKPEKAKNT